MNTQTSVDPGTLDADQDTKVQTRPGRFLLSTVRTNQVSGDFLKFTKDRQRDDVVLFSGPGIPKSFELLISNQIQIMRLQIDYKSSTYELLSELIENLLSMFEIAFAMALCIIITHVSLSKTYHISVNLFIY